MSIIFGYINLTKKPVERTTLETMKKAMDFWGPDGEGLWIEDTCGLGNLLYYNTPEALYEKLPVTDISGNLVMTAGARIDNREKLFRIFDISLGRRLTMPDSALMLMAYEKWGDACSDHLVGDWALAIWDRRERKLFLARDHHGITALYYYKGDGFFVFSSSLKGILCLPQVPKKINEYKIAQLLVNWNEGGPTTCYLDIMRLPPAHTLTVKDGKVATNRYWYLEHTPEVHLKNDQEYADMFLDLYTEAVRCRLRSHRPVGATLSSGLDSGSVCILAAKELAKQGKRLQAYTAVPLYDVPAPPNRIGDEGPLAMALAEKLGNVDVTLCRAEGIGVLEGVEKMLEIVDEPTFAPSNANWIIDILQKTNSHKNGTLLIGQNGNGTISWPSGHILSKRRSLLIIKLRVLKQYIKLQSGYWERRFIINKNISTKYNFKKQMVKAKLRSYFRKDQSSSEIRMQVIRPGKIVIGDIWYQLGVCSKLSIRDPTVDLRLMKFLVGIPENSKLYNSRELFSINFNQWFPEYLVNGVKRGTQAIDLRERINIEKLKLENMIINGSSSFNRLVSLDKLHKFSISESTNSSELELIKAYLVWTFINEKL